VRRHLLLDGFLPERPVGARTSLLNAGRWLVQVPLAVISDGLPRRLVRLRVLSVPEGNPRLGCPARPSRPRWAATAPVTSRKNRLRAATVVDMVLRAVIRVVGGRGTFVLILAVIDWRSRVVIIVPIHVVASQRRVVVLAIRVRRVLCST